MKTVGVCGGHAKIRNTRIPVWTIISLQQQGADTPELLRNFPSLTTDDLSNTQFYYTTHQEEIDRLSPIRARGSDHWLDFIPMKTLRSTLCKFCATTVIWWHSEPEYIPKDTLTLIQDPEADRIICIALFSELATSSHLSSCVT